MSLLNFHKRRLYQVVAPLATNLRLVNVTDTSVSVEWDAVAEAESYELEAKAKSRADWVKYYTGTGLTYTNSNLNPETAYEARVWAINSAGRTVSNVLEFTTVSGLPDAPTSINFTNVGTSSLKINWTASANADTYSILRRIKGVSGGFDTIKTGLTSTSYTDTTVDDGTTYEFIVRAINTAGYTNSTISEITTPIAPPQTAPALTVNSFDTDSIALSWTAVENTSLYSLMALLPGASTYTQIEATPNLNYTYAAESGKTYKFYVIAKNSAGSSPDSNIVEVTTIVDTYEYNLVGSSPSANTIVLDWDDIPGADFYRMESKYSEDTIWDEYKDPNTGEPVNYLISEITFDDAFFPVGTNLDFRVRASINGQFANYSNIVSVTIAEAEPTYEPETIAYLDAQSIPDDSTASAYPNKTNHDVWMALDETIKYYKAQGVWAYMPFFYPRISLDPTVRGLNAKDINKWQEQYSGSWVHDALGSHGNGSNTKAVNGYQDTNKESYHTSDSAFNLMMAVLSDGSAGMEFSYSTSAYLSIRRGTKMYYMPGTTTNYEANGWVATNPSAQGIYVGNITPYVAVQMRKDDVLIIDGAGEPRSTFSTNSYMFGARFNAAVTSGADYYSDKTTGSWGVAIDQTAKYAELRQGILMLEQKLGRI